MIRRHPLSSDVPPVRNRGELPKDSSIAFAIGLKYDVRAIPGPDGKAIASFERDAPQDGEVRHDGGIAGDLEALANAQVVGLWTTRNHFAL